VSNITRRRFIQHSGSGLVSRLGLPDLRSFGIESEENTSSGLLRYEIGMGQMLAEGAASFTIRSTNATGRSKHSEGGIVPVYRTKEERIQINFPCVLVIQPNLGVW
jgi:hypothetical protein